MNSKKLIVTTLLVAAMIAGAGLARIAAAGQETANSQWIAVKRKTLAIRYKNNDSTTVNIVGSAIDPRAIGKAEIKHENGRTRIKLEIENLGNPQAIGPFYTTFVLWAIAPEGQADNLAELPIKNKINVDVTTNFQTFGLIITAEPHSAVKLPSPVIVADNTLRRGTEGGIQTSSIEYTGDPGTFYAASSSEPLLAADYNTPLLILGARRSVEIARRAGARRYAEIELRDAEVKLASLEQTWPERRKDQEKYSGAAHDVMRIAENARTQAVERNAQARLADERRDNALTLGQAQNDADRAQNKADRAQNDADNANLRAASDRDAMTRAQIESAAARARAEQAQSETDKAKASEESARADAERARLDTQLMKDQQSDVQQRLYISLSEILETRREARGLIVNLSDVLFDFNQATLKPGAREKLSKLAGILLAYPGSYRMQIEGHTDSVGSQDYNQKLSEDRAQAVHDYLISAALPADRMNAVRGFGKIRPVATNDTAEGRQTNRRVEIVISDTEK
ncbi:MAG TPA: OmpA family protein [Blastocatellia bacterium]|nr:OmpA family protein [Blastocatellia bacterium]